MTMPELPEVETVVRDLCQSGIEGLSFQSTQTFWPKTIDTSTPKIFDQQIKGRKIQSISRRAKFIVFELTPTGWLLVHLRMTGRLDLLSKNEPLDSHVRISTTLSDGRELRFTDIRKFGRWYFYESEPPQFNTLGPEPLSKDFTVKLLEQKLAGSKRRIKSFLLDQTTVAGLGNIYVDEALWQAKIHPLATTSQLGHDQIKLLHTAIIDVLEKGIRNSGTTLGKTNLNYYTVLENDVEQIKIHSKSFVEQGYLALVAKRSSSGLL
jgi:formamidopyrimidine-DNA glycosylase